MEQPGDLVLGELDGLKLGDARLEHRARLIMAELAADPKESFPRTFSCPAQLEAFYRFLRNDRVDFDGLLQPHVHATVRRCEGRTVRVAHDTTSFSFDDECDRDGLGLIKGRGGQGFYMHAAVAVGDGEERSVLGFLGAMTFVRPKSKGGEPRESESKRWGELVAVTRAHVGEGAELVHVMDREADIYSLLAQLQRDNERFVIRHRERLLSPGSQHRTTRELLFDAEVRVCRTAALGARGGKQSGKARLAHPPRDERSARLSFSATGVILPRPASAPHDCPEQLAVNLVLAKELDPPQGEKAVEWMLLTAEPIDTAEQVLAVVDHYRARWRIEECFKSIKSGCCFEKRQLASYKTLLVALGLTLPIAFTLMQLRDLGRRDDKQPASEILSALEIEVLRAAQPKMCPPSLTVRDAMLAIAKLGGHIKNNGEPGWSTLGFGYQKLLTLIEGVVLARRM